MKLEVTIPESLEEITLNQFQRYNSLPEMDHKSLMLQMIRIFCGISNPTVLKMTDIKEIVLNLNKLLDSENDLIQRFTLKGDDKEIEFGLIPNLETMSFGEYIDLEKYISKWETFHQAMAILYRPVIRSSKTLYDIEEYQGTDKYSDVMKHAPMSVVYGVMVFFYHLGKELLNDTLRSLENQLKELKKKQEKGQTSLKEDNLIKNGDGIAQSIYLLTKISLNSKPSLKQNSNPVSYNSSISEKKQNLKTQKSRKRTTNKKKI